MANLPPLPKIEGDVELLLDVFTHSSLRMTGAPLNEDYGDTERLAELGAYVLQLVVATYWFHSKDPSLPATELNAKIKESLSESTVDAWMNAYGLKTKLRIAPSEMHIINSAKDMRKMFETYVGAVYFRNRNGLQEIQNWISRLIDPDGAPVTLQDIPEHTQRYPPAPTYTTHAPPPAPAAPPPPPPPPQCPPPPMPTMPPYGLGKSAYNNSVLGYSSGSQMLSMISVALLNQKATQNGYQVTYPAEHSGPPHAPTWNVKCCLNGREYGRGTGRSQKVAKEEAARGAWTAMGW